MRYTLTIMEADAERLITAVTSELEREGAAYLLCGRSTCQGETRLLVRDVIPVANNDYLVRERDRLSIASVSYAAVAKRALLRGDSILFVHSHPTGVDDFSAQDDREEPKLMEFFSCRVPGVLHGSFLVVSPTQWRARIWTQEGWRRVDRIRQFGARFRFQDDAAEHEPIPEFFDRQVRAFGPDIQRLLARLHIGIVGVGGTGSAVAEQLYRLGVGTLSLFDGEFFEHTNVNRVYGSTLQDEGRPKTAIAKQHLDRIGMGSVVHALPDPITQERTAAALRNCDLVFGCTDKQAPRGILVRLALWYLIPVIDVGVKIDAPDGVLRGVDGRITVLLPGEACLFCRGRITPEMIRLESLSPEEWQALADERYAPALQDTAPAVIPFTTMVAAQAVSELLQRLTGFMGAERRSSETLHFFHEPAVRTNRPVPTPDCLCAHREYWGRGDRRNLLDLIWEEPKASYTQ